MRVAQVPKMSDHEVKPEPNPNQLNLSIKNQSDHEVNFKVKPTTKFNKASFQAVYLRLTRACSKGAKYIHFLVLTAACTSNKVYL